MKFSRLFSDVNIDNSAKFCEVSMSRSCISRKQAIWAFFDFANPYFTDQMNYVNLFFDITHLFCKFWVSKVQNRSNRNSLFSGNATSGHANFTKFCRIINIQKLTQKILELSILTSEINHVNFNIGYFTEQFVKWCKILVCKIQNGY